MFSQAHTEVELLDALPLAVIERFLHPRVEAEEVRGVLSGSQASLVVPTQANFTPLGGVSRRRSWALVTAR